MLTRFAIWEKNEQTRIYLNGICKPQEKIWIEKIPKTEKNKNENLALDWIVKTKAKKNSEIYSLIESGTVYRIICSWIEDANKITFDELVDKIEIINATL